MRTFTKPILVLFCFLAWMGVSCNREGVGGKASISGVVMHHDSLIHGAVVFIKYGATDWPGFDSELYDDEITTSASDASFSFTNLFKGDYYLYARGFDPAFMQEVMGGMPVEIEKKKEDKVVTVFVVE